MNPIYALARPESGLLGPEVKTVNGITVKVYRRILPPEEAARKRAQIAQVVAQSILRRQRA